MRKCISKVWDCVKGPRQKEGASGTYGENNLLVESGDRERTEEGLARKDGGNRARE